MTRLALIAIAVLLSGCSTTEPWKDTPFEDDPAGWLGCDTLSKQISSAGGAEVAYALPAPSRAAFAAAVAEHAGHSTIPTIADAAVVLTRSTTSPDAWRLGLDTIAGRCLDSGWKP